MHPDNDAAWQQQLDPLCGTSLLSLKKRGLCTIGNCRTSSPLQSTALKAFSDSSTQICLLERAASQPGACRHIDKSLTERLLAVSNVCLQCFSIVLVVLEVQGMPGSKEKTHLAVVSSQCAMPTQAPSTALRRQPASRTASCLSALLPTRLRRLPKGACAEIGVIGRPGRMSICRDSLVPQ